MTHPCLRQEPSPEEAAAAAVAAIRDKGNKHYAAKEWEAAIACYDEVQLQKQQHHATRRASEP